MRVARQIGTICYRSRAEFDKRFKSDFDLHENNFDVEKYLQHASEGFADVYDANCYLTLSECMDLQDVSMGFKSIKNAIKQINPCVELMLLSVEQDALIPAHELDDFASECGEIGLKLHSERLTAQQGQMFED